jgi:hypothetical protein
MDLFETIIENFTKKNLSLILFFIIFLLLTINFDKYYHLFLNNLSSILLTLPVLILLVIYITYNWAFFIKNNGILIIATILIPAFYIYINFSENTEAMIDLVIAVNERNCVIANNLLCSGEGQYATSYFVTDVYKNNYAYIIRSPYFNNNLRQNLNKVIFNMESANYLMDYVQKLEVARIGEPFDEKFILDHYSKAKIIAAELELALACNINKCSK